MSARLCFRTVTLFASFAATACGSSQEPSESSLPSGPEIVSDAIAQPQGRGSSAFVSMPPGGLTFGVKATIRNAATGDLKTVDIVNGGWDPVAIAARAGDSLRMTIMAGNLGSREYMHVVPRGRNPMILRTEPLAGSEDVGIYSRIVVVFSEPINPASVTPARVHLRRWGLPVAADVRFSESGLEMEVLPQERLAPFSSYVLIVSPDLADRVGDRLERGVQVQFTTEALDPLTEALVLPDGPSREWVR